MKCKIIIKNDLWVQEDLGRTNEKIMAEIVSAMKKEHEGYYGTPAGSAARWRGCGFLRSEWSSWTTSGGNRLLVRLDNIGDLHIFADGRRHGIPWRFLPWDLREYILTKSKKGDHWEMGPTYSIFMYQTQCPDLPPWETVGDRPSQWWDGKED